MKTCSRGELDGHISITLKKIKARQKKKVTVCGMPPRLLASERSWIVNFLNTVFPEDSTINEAGSKISFCTLWELQKQTNFIWKQQCEVEITLWHRNPTCIKKILILNSDLHFSKDFCSKYFSIFLSFERSGLTSFRERKTSFRLCITLKIQKKESFLSARLY